jgi:iron(III) transport system permease protein
MARATQVGAVKAPARTDAAASALLRKRVRQVATGQDRLMLTLILLAGLWLVVVVVLPLYQILAHSFTDQAGNFVGFANFAKYFGTPALYESLTNSLTVAGITTFLAVTLGFAFAYALTHTAMPGKPIFRTLALLPLFAPPLVYAVALVYLFGNKGLVTTGLFGALPGVNIHLYGLVGIVLAELLYCFPQAVLILTVALSLIDARLYEAAIALRTSRWRTFLTVTMPAARYGLISAIFVCFTLAFTDFGGPEVVGGNYNVLATDMYKQVIGQQNFAMGSTISILLLLPAVLAFVVDRIVQRRQVAMLTTRSVPYVARRDPLMDRPMVGFCTLTSLLVLLVIGTALFASLVRFWPYNLSLTLDHYTFKGVGGGGYEAFWTSVQMSLFTAVAGTIIVFVSAYLVEKGRGARWARSATYFLSILPVALPGLVLGLAYIFFFNNPTLSVFGLRLPNPLNVLYGTMAILVISNIVHFYTVSFLTATTALKQLDSELESVGASQGVPFYKTFWRVTVPVSLPAILEIGMYYFVNSMVTVSAVIFLLGPSVKLASVAVVNMNDAGETSSAAAMSMLIVGTSLLVRMLYSLATLGLRRRSQAWTKR